MQSLLTTPTDIAEQHWRSLAGTCQVPSAEHLVDCVLVQRENYARGVGKSMMATRSGVGGDGVTRWRRNRSWQRWAVSEMAARTRVKTVGTSQTKANFKTNRTDLIVVWRIKRFYELHTLSFSCLAHRVLPPSIHSVPRISAELSSSPLPQCTQKPYKSVVFVLAPPQGATWTYIGMLHSNTFSYKQFKENNSKSIILSTKVILRHINRNITILEILLTQC